MDLDVVMKTVSFGSSFCCVCAATRMTAATAGAMAAPLGSGFCCFCAAAATITTTALATAAALAK